MPANPPITVGELVDVPAPQSPVNAQFHQEVANRITHRFANVAAMNAWAAANGSMAYSADTGFHYARVGGAWVALARNSDMTAAPLGIIGRGLCTQNRTFTNTAADLVGATVTVTCVANRWYRAYGVIPSVMQNVAGHQSFWIAVGAFKTGAGSTHWANAGEYRSHYVDAVAPGTLSGAQTFKLQGATLQGGQQMSTDLAADNIYIIVEDCGAV